MLNTEQINEAWHLRSIGKSWKDIGESLGIRPWNVREALYPDWGRKERQRTADRVRLFREGRRRVGVRSWVHAGTRQRMAPPEVIEERERALTPELTLSQIFLGDPKPGRSALDQKRRLAGV